MDDEPSSNSGQNCLLCLISFATKKDSQGYLFLVMVTDLGKGKPVQTELGNLANQEPASTFCLIPFLQFPSW